MKHEEEQERIYIACFLFIVISVPKKGSNFIKNRNQQQENRERVFILIDCNMIYGDDCSHNNGKSFSYFSDYFEIFMFLFIRCQQKTELNTKNGRHVVHDQCYFQPSNFYFGTLSFFYKNISFIRNFMSD